MEAGVLRYGLFLSLERNCSKNVSAVSAFVSGIKVAVKTQREEARQFSSWFGMVIDNLDKI